MKNIEYKVIGRVDPRKKEKGRIMVPLIPLLQAMRRLCDNQLQPGDEELILRVVRENVCPKIGVDWENNRCPVVVGFNHRERPVLAFDQRQFAMNGGRPPLRAADAQDLSLFKSSACIGLRLKVNVSEVLAQADD